MTPTVRNAAIAAAITLVPAIAAAALYPDRARALPGQVSGRVRDLLENEDDVETSARRVVSRLEDLAQRLDRRAIASRAPEISPLAAIGAGLAALVVVPTALAAVFAPHKFREAREAAFGHWGRGAEETDEIEDELSDITARLDTLSDDIERQRADNFDAVTGAKNAG